MRAGDKRGLHPGAESLPASKSERAGNRPYPFDRYPDYCAGGCNSPLMESGPNCKDRLI